MKRLFDPVDWRKVEADLKAELGLSGLTELIDRSQRGLGHESELEIGCELGCGRKRQRTEDYSWKRMKELPKDYTEYEEIPNSLPVWSLPILS